MLFSLSTVHFESSSSSPFTVGEKTGSLSGNKQWCREVLIGGMLELYVFWTIKVRENAGASWWSVSHRREDRPISKRRQTRAQPLERNRLVSQIKLQLIFGIVHVAGSTLDAKSSKKLTTVETCISRLLPAGSFGSITQQDVQQAISGCNKTSFWCET